MKRITRFSSSVASTFIGSLLLSLAGCATAPFVVPAGGADHAMATAGGATLTVFPSAWEGDPDDLADYVTPVLVEIRNDGPQEVRVSYFDFALTDQSGFRYAALNPFVPASAALDPRAKDQSSSSSLAKTERRQEQNAVGVTLVAFRGGGGVRIGAPPARGGFAPRVGPGYGGRFAVPPSAGPGFRRGGYVGGGFGGYGGGRYGGGYGYGGGPRFSGYAVLPYYRPWFGAGFGFGYWNDPFFYPPGYATWVWGWSPTYYPSRSVPTDVINNGLPEGVLQPGGHVEGFLYFQRSHPTAQQLSLTWNVTDPRSGTATGQARVLLEMQRR